jgi:hypothetical protein
MYNLVSRQPNEIQNSCCKKLKLHKFSNRNAKPIRGINNSHNLLRYWLGREKLNIERPRRKTPTILSQITVQKNIAQSLKMATKKGQTQALTS